MKFESKNLKTAGIDMVGMLAGAMASRVVAGFIPVKNETVKRAVMTAVPLVAGAMVKGDFVKSLTIGASATQAGYLVKSLAGDKVKNETVQKALGCPGEVEEPIIIYTEDYQGLNAPVEEAEYDFITKDDDFLALPSDEEFASC